MSQATQNRPISPAAALLEALGVSGTDHQFVGPRGSVASVETLVVDDGEYIAALEKAVSDSAIQFSSEFNYPDHENERTVLVHRLSGAAASVNGIPPAPPEYDYLTLFATVGGIPTWRRQLCLNEVI
jgi:hypothetical protein